MEGRLPISLAIFFLSFFTFVTALEERGSSRGMDVDLDKRPYARMDMSEYKRLPLYNFGLGKRSPRYNFGLGKRNLDEEEVGNEYNEYPIIEEDEFAAPEQVIYTDEESHPSEKQEKIHLFESEKRVPQNKYNFGLGRRAGPYDFGLGKRTQRFNFGLGKRNGLYSFGLGKKNADPGPLGNRFSFGLGKRFADFEADGERGKREVSAKDEEEVSSRMEAESSSHELEKRSKNSVSNSNKSSGSIRKPSSTKVDFGKREPQYDFGLGKRNLQSVNSF